MQFNMVRPCPHCPFRKDNVPFLHPERAKDIADGLKMGTWFGCHETIEFVDENEDEGELKCVDTTEHCAGAMILMEKINRPTQAMQLSERLRYPPERPYDRDRLDMESPVFKTLEEFVAFHAKL
jgi:hypothetical protein